MVFFLSNLYKKYLSKEVVRFIIIGSSTVILDLLCYYTLINFGFLSSLSKGISFTVGAIYAYIANKNFTFQNQNYYLLQFCLFILLYVLTLMVNVITNELILNFFGITQVSFVFAFIIATFVSATLNFLGMKYIVFSKKGKIKR